MTYVPVPIEMPKPQASERTWGEEILLAETPHYTLKLLRYKAGAAGGLQMHTQKDEAFSIVSGRAFVDSDNGTGTLVRRVMVPGDTCRIPPGAAHRFLAIDDCEVYEASTPHKDDRVRLERYFGEPEVEGLPSTAPEPEREPSTR